MPLRHVFHRSQYTQSCINVVQIVVTAVYSGLNSRCEGHLQCRRAPRIVEDNNWLPVTSVYRKCRWALSELYRFRQWRVLYRYTYAYHTIHTSKAPIGEERTRRDFAGMSSLRKRCTYVFDVHMYLISWNVFAIIIIASYVMEFIGDLTCCFFSISTLSS